MSKTLICLSAFSLLAAAQAVAQEAPADAAPPVSAEVQESAAEPAGSALEDVVVTATRRETRLSEVPIAITEVSGERLYATVIRDTQSLPNCSGRPRCDGALSSSLRCGPVAPTKHGAPRPCAAWPIAIDSA